MFLTTCDGYFLVHSKVAILFSNLSRMVSFPFVSRVLESFPVRLLLQVIKCFLAFSCIIFSVHLNWLQNSCSLSSIYYAIQVGTSEEWHMILPRRLLLLLHNYLKQFFLSFHVIFLPLEKKLFFWNQGSILFMTSLFILFFSGDHLMHVVSLWFALFDGSYDFVVDQKVKTLDAQMLLCFLSEFSRPFSLFCCFVSCGLILNSWSAVTQKAHWTLMFP